MIDTKQIQPTYSGSFVRQAVANSVFLTIPLLDDTNNQILVEVHACDTGGNELENLSCQTWYRNGTGNATIVGTEKGPAPASTIAQSTVLTDCVTLAGSGANVTVSFATVGSAKINVTWAAYVVTRPLARS